MHFDLCFVVSRVGTIIGQVLALQDVAVCLFHFLWVGGELLGGSFGQKRKVLRDVCFEGGICRVENFVIDAGVLVHEVRQQVLLAGSQNDLIVDVGNWVYGQTGKEKRVSCV